MTHSRSGGKSGLDKKVAHPIRIGSVSNLCTLSRVDEDGGVMCVGCPKVDNLEMVGEGRKG